MPERKTQRAKRNTRRAQAAQPRAQAERALAGLDGPLWRRYFRRRSRAARLALFLHHRPLARYLAGRLAKQLSVPIDELLGAAELGVWKSIPRYDARHGYRFSSFAPLRIRGEMLDQLREEGQASRLHLVCEQTRAQLTSQLAHQLGRRPTLEEIESRLDARVLAFTQRPDFASLDAPICRANSSREPRETTGADLAQARDAETYGGEEIEALAELVRPLRRTEKIVLLLLYQRERRTMKEAGQLLGVCESRVSQIHSQALATLAAHGRKLLE